MRRSGERRNNGTATKPPSTGTAVCPQLGCPVPAPGGCSLLPCGVATLSPVGVALGWLVAEPGDRGSGDAATGCVPFSPTKPGLLQRREPVLTALLQAQLCWWSLEARSVSVCCKDLCWLRSWKQRWGGGSRVCAAGATPVPPAPSGAAGRSQEERGACRGDGLLGLFKAIATKSSL